MKAFRCIFDRYDRSPGSVRTACNSSEPPYAIYQLGSLKIHAGGALSSHGTRRTIRRATARLFLRHDTRKRERHARPRQQSGLAGAFLMTLLMVGVRPRLRAAISGWSRRPGTRTSRQVRTLLNQRADVNVRSDDGSTALLWAAHWNDLETADLLIRAGADANAANDFRMTPLSQACTNGSAALVDLLLKAGANPNTPIATGETPIMTCASSGSADAVRMLLARGADVNAKEPSQNQTALMWAAAEHHPDVVRNAHRGAAPTFRPTRKTDSPRCTLRRGRATWRAPGCCWPRAWTSISGRSRTSRTSRQAAKAERRAAAQAAASRASRMRRRICRQHAVARGHGERPRAARALPAGAGRRSQCRRCRASRPCIGRRRTWEGGVSNPVYGFADPMSGIPDRQAKLQLVKALLAHGANPNARMTRRAAGIRRGLHRTRSARRRSCSPARLPMSR